MLAEEEESVFNQLRRFRIIFTQIKRENSVIQADLKDLYKRSTKHLISKGKCHFWQGHLNLFLNLYQREVLT